MKVYVKPNSLRTGVVGSEGRVHVGKEFAGESLEIAILNPETAEDTSVKNNNKRKYYNRHSGEVWKHARKAALDRDNNQCVVCGVTQEQHRESKERFGGLHVHHVTPVRQFDCPDDAHELNNLLTLCDEHHFIAENEGLRAVCEISALPECVRKSL